MLNLREDFFQEDWNSYQDRIEKALKENDLMNLIELAESFSVLQNSFDLDEICIEAIEGLLSSDQLGLKLIMENKSDSYVLQKLRINIMVRDLNDEYFRNLYDLAGNSDYQEILKFKDIDLRNLLEYMGVSEFTIFDRKTNMLAIALTEKIYPDSSKENDKWESLDDDFRRAKSLFISSDYSLTAHEERKRILKESKLNGTYSREVPNLSGLLFAISKRDFIPGRITIWEEEIELLSSRECLILVQILILLIEENTHIPKEIILYPIRKIFDLSSRVK